MSTKVKVIEAMDEQQRQHSVDSDPDSQNYLDEVKSKEGHQDSNQPGEKGGNENNFSSLNQAEINLVGEKNNGTQNNKITQLTGIESVQAGCKEGSPQNTSSNNSSLRAEQTPNNNFLNEFLEGIKNVKEIKNEGNCNATKTLSEENHKEGDNDVEHTNQQIKHNHSEKASSQQRKSTEIDESSLNMLIKRAIESSNLCDSGDENQNIKIGDRNISETESNLFPKKQSENNTEISSDPNIMQMIRNQASNMSVFQDTQNSPSIKLCLADNHPDSTPQSLCLDTKESFVQEKDNTNPNNVSILLPQGLTPNSQDVNHSSNLLTISQHGADAPSPNVSLFAQMTKQQSKRDIKNWALNKSFIGRGSGNLTGSAQIQGNAAANSMSQFILQKKISMNLHPGGQGDSKDLDALNDSSYNNSSMIDQLSESVPVNAQPKKTISLLGHNKKQIKITNTTSTELKKYNFQDDDLITLDQNVYQNLAQSYNINQNIGISIKTLLNYQISSSIQKNIVNLNQNSANLASSPSKTVTAYPYNLNANVEEKKTANSQFSESFKTNNENSSNSLDNVSHTSSSSHKAGNADNKSIFNEKEDQNDLENTGLLDTPPKIESVSVKKVVIPVLLSVKTEEQMLSYQYIDQMEQKSEKDIHSLHQIDSNKESPIKLSHKRASIDKIEIKNAIDEVHELNYEKGKQSSSNSSCPSNSDILSGQDQGSSEDNNLTSLEQNIDGEQAASQDQIQDSQNDSVARPKISQKNILLKQIKTKAQKQREQLNQEKKSSDLAQINEAIASDKKLSAPQNKLSIFSGICSQFQSTPMRFPIDLICVIDTSGSMNGEPLELLKETLLFLVDLLQTGDRICLIQFSTNAKRLTPLLSIDSKTNVETIKQEINKLIAKGGTNISQGMQLAFDVLKQRRLKNPITSVFLLSDGLNDGAENRIRDLLKQLNFYQNYNEENFTIQTFGFGKDHDPDLMDKISQLMDGNFYYIGDIHRIDECFIDALGGLFSVISQNVAIQVKIPPEMRNKIKIVKTYGDMWHVKEQYYEYTININQLLCGVSKDYILEIEVDSKLIEDSQCIQEIHSEEEVQSSECIGSNRNFDAKSLSVQQIFNILEIQLIAKHISVNTNHASSFKLQKDEEKLNLSSAVFQPSAPDLQLKDHCLSSQNQEKRSSFMSAILPNSGGDLVHEKSSSFSKSGVKTAIQGSKSQSECSQLSINIIPTGSDDQTQKNENPQYKSISEFNQDVIVKKDTLDLKNHKQIQENLVKVHYLRVKGAECLDKCQTLALQKKFDEGNEYVSKLLLELNEQPEDTRKSLSKLIIDLTEVQDNLRKKVGEQIGWHRMISCKRMHMEQRSTGTDLTYQNSVQKIMVQRRKSFKDQNSISSLTETIAKLQFGHSSPNGQAQEDKHLRDIQDLTSSESSNDSSSGDEGTPKKKLSTLLIRKNKSYTTQPTLSHQSNEQDCVKDDQEGNIGSNTNNYQNIEENNKEEEVHS